MDEKTKNLMFSKKSDEWSTPQDLYDKLDEIFDFTLDPCASHENHKCSKYYTIQTDGLSQDWDGERAFVNPPYSDNKRWSLKCVEEGLKDDSLTVVLMPARVETKYFQDLLFPNSKYIVFIKRRLKFGGHKNSAPFPSALCIITSRDISNEELLMLKELGRVVCEKRSNL